MIRSALRDAVVPAMAEAVKDWWHTSQCPVACVAQVILVVERVGCKIHQTYMRRLVGHGLRLVCIRSCVCVCGSLPQREASTKKAKETFFARKDVFHVTLNDQSCKEVGMRGSRYKPGSNTGATKWKGGYRQSQSQNLSHYEPSPRLR